jgi:hypothetical protein
LAASGLSAETRQAIGALNDLAAQMDRARALVHSEPVLPAKPAGWWTVEEYRNHHKLPVTTAGHHVNRLVSLGRAERCKAYVPDSRHRMVVTQIYRMLP